MKKNRHFTRFLGIGVMSLLFACNSNGGYGAPSGQSPGAAGQGGPSPTPSSSWSEVSEQTACEALNPAQCVGVYGFHVMPDGTYQAGPSPGGQTAQGSITSLELQMLDNDIRQLSQADLNSTLVCQSGSVIAGIQDKVTVTEAGNNYVIYEGESIPDHGSQCTAGDPASAEQLHSDLRNLMEKYYPTPFPS